MQVTISFLPIPLSLVRIPRSRLSKLSHPLLRQILRPSPTFLSITCNELELSIFAEKDMLEDFEHIAKKDRRRRQARMSIPRDKNTSDDHDYIEISYDTWNVLQIDSHSNGLDNSGARIHELSAPLAAAGISILYLSSYMSDFIFVKSTRIKGVMSLMAAAGFDLYSSDCPLLTSPPLSPTSMDDSLSVLDISADFGTPTVITRSRSSTDSSLASMLLGTSMNDPSDSSEEDAVSVNSGSHSPTSSGVTILKPTLACIGLSDDHADTWALKIVKLVSFPDLICARTKGGQQKHSPTHSPRSPSFEFDCQADGILTPSDSSDDEDEKQQQHDLTDPLPKPPLESQVSFYSFTRTCEGSSLTTDVKLLAALFPPTERDMVICSDELINADSQLSTRPFLPHAPLHLHLPPSSFPSSESDDEQDPEAADPNEADEDGDPGKRALSGTMKCLQIDLRKFGLDKYGVVTRYSKVLQEHGINHMYSSTFKTANLLVDKTHARRARELLCTW